MNHPWAPRQNSNLNNLHSNVEQGLANEMIRRTNTPVSSVNGSNNIHETCNSQGHETPQQTQPAQETQEAAIQFQELAQQLSNIEPSMSEKICQSLRELNGLAPPSNSDVSQQPMSHDSSASSMSSVASMHTAVANLSDLRRTSWASADDSLSSTDGSRRSSWSSLSEGDEDSELMDSWDDVSMANCHPDHPNERFPSSGSSSPMSEKNQEYRRDSLVRRKKRQKVEVSYPASMAFSLQNQQQQQQQREVVIPQVVSPQVTYDEGMNVYPDPIQVPSCDQAVAPSNSMNSFQPPNLIMALLYNLGQIHLNRGGQDDKALKFFRLALDVCQEEAPSTTSGRTTCVNPIIEISILHNIAFVHYRRFEYSQALEIFSQVHRLARHSFGALHPSVAAALNCIGVVLFHMKNGDDKKAAGKDVHSEDDSRSDLEPGPILLKSLKTQMLISSEIHDDDQGRMIFLPKQKERLMATTLNNLGRVAFNAKQYMQAQSFYQEALSMRRNVLGYLHIDVAATAFNVGQTHHKLGNLEGAVSHYKEFLTIASQILGENHRDVVILLKHLGQVYHEHRHCEEARTYYAMALERSRLSSDERWGYYNRDSASILNMLGNSYYESGDFDNAIRSYEEGLIVERVVLHPYCANIVVTLSNIGQALMHQGEYRKALEKYQEAHSIQCKQGVIDRAGEIVGRKSEVKKMAETLSIIGQISSLLGLYSAAQVAFSKVVALRRQALGDHVDVALALNYLGLVLFKQGLMDEAMVNFEESLRIRQLCPNSTSHASGFSPSGSSDNNNSGDIAVLMYNIASIHLHKGDNENALKYYKDALVVEKETLGTDHPDVAVTLKLIGKVYDRCGQYDEALGYYQQAVDIYKKNVEQLESRENSNGENIVLNGAQRKGHLRNAGRLLVLIASIHLRKADTQQMSIAISEAYRIYQTIDAPMDELELAGFDLYELAMDHPECAPAA